MDISNAADRPEYSLITRQNVSLSATGRRLVFAALLMVTFAIALGMGYFGAWPVLPFAGLEMLVLYLAFRYVERRAGDYERITIVGDKLLVELREVGRLSRYEFNRHWAQVVLRDDPAGCRIALRSHGREVEVGAHLTGDQRLAVGRQLRERLGGTLR